ncbi:MAG: sulfotransferase [Flavobacteriales bacterium]|nr:sulfotransferase [Flavobacteriales bacterium]MCB9198699.1 sulfotransferase [Flavobacteriales bacterium]
MSEYEVKQHQLFISSYKLLRKLKRQNELSTEGKVMFRKIMLMTLFTAPFRWLQLLLFTRRIKKVDLKNNPPVFVLGHWRSGTTHLHYLLSLDERFGYLENFQAFFFRVALISKTFMKPILNFFMPSTRPQDNIKITANSPSEEEHPLTNLTEKSGMQTFFFPRNRSYYDKYNIFKGTTPKERTKWKKIYHWMLQNIAYYAGKDKTLLLKNPHSMGRIEVLLELYPNAKFIHIHRDPYDVYNSNLHLYRSTIKTQFLQDFSDEEIIERVLYCYETSFVKFFEDYHKIPEENRIEISYDELSNVPMETLQNVYKGLGLGGFENVQPKLEAYLNKEKNYKTNQFKEIPSSELKQINSRWKFVFDHYNYPISEN